MQELVDIAEDDWSNKCLQLNLSDFGARYITSRIYDISNLRTLILENNRIKKLSDQLSYLTKYWIWLILVAIVES